MIGVLKGNIARTLSTTPGGQDLPRWIVIAIVGWIESQVMRSKLESADIPCILQRETAGAVLGILVGPLGEVRVLVPEPMVDQAIELLSEDFSEVIDEDFTEEDEDTPPD